jgi:hypothetical protein
VKTNHAVPAGSLKERSYATLKEQKLLEALATYQGRHPGLVAGSHMVRLSRGLAVGTLALAEVFEQLLPEDRAMGRALVMIGAGLATEQDRETLRQWIEQREGAGKPVSPDLRKLLEETPT